MNESQIEEMQQSKGVEPILRERIAELEAQIPKVVVTPINGKCPNCGGYCGWNYCCHCGAKLNWGD